MLDVGRGSKILVWATLKDNFGKSCITSCPRGRRCLVCSRSSQRANALTLSPWILGESAKDRSLSGAALQQTALT